MPGERQFQAQGDRQGEGAYNFRRQQQTFRMVEGGVEGHRRDHDLQGGGGGEAMDDLGGQTFVLGTRGRQHQQSPAVSRVVRLAREVYIEMMRAEGPTRECGSNPGKSLVY